MEKIINSLFKQWERIEMDSYVNCQIKRIKDEWDNLDVDVQAMIIGTLMHCNKIIDYSKTLKENSYQSFKKIGVLRSKDDLLERLNDINKKYLGKEKELMRKQLLLEAVLVYLHDENVVKACYNI